MIYFNRKDDKELLKPDPNRTYYTEVRETPPSCNSKCDALGHDWYLVDNGDGSGYFKCARCGAT